MYRCTGLLRTSKCCIQNWHCTTDHNPLILDCSASFQITKHQFRSPHFISLSTRMLEETKSKSLLYSRTNNIHCSTLIHHTRHFIVEGYHVSQAWFPLHKAMLITHGDLFVFNVFEVIFRRICSIIFPWTEKQLTSVLFPWTFLLVFLSPAYITHGRRLTSVPEAFVAFGGLSDFCLICLFFQL